MATGTRHKVSVVGDAETSVGNQNLGTVNLLPPTLTAQWHFNPDQTIDPYIGAGVNYTHSFDPKLTFSDGAFDGTAIKIQRNRFGVVGQAGVDVNLGSGWLINADVKYVTLNTNVKAELAPGVWTKIDDLDINPWVLGIGIGKKF